MKRRIDENSEKEVNSSEISQEKEIKEGAKKQKAAQKYSATLYVIILFVVVILLIFLSYFMQNRNSQALKDLAAQQNEFSIEALANIEELQQKNMDLMTQVAELEEELKEAKEGLSEEDKENLIIKNEVLIALVNMEIAIEADDMEAAEEYADFIKKNKEFLAEEHVEKYENLTEKIK